MSSFSALQAVSAAVTTTLNVASFTALSTGGVYDDIPQGTAFPMTLFSVQERNLGGMGTKAGVGRVLQIDLRVHVYSQYAGYDEAHGIAAKAIELLQNPPAVTGYGSWSIVHDDTTPTPGDQVIAGVKVKEVVAQFRLFVEEQ